MSDDRQRVVVVVFQQLLDAGKSGKRTASVDRPTRLLRQLLFSDSECQVVSFAATVFCSAVYFCTCRLSS